jgi:hypothetical protein
MGVPVHAVVKLIKDKTRTTGHRLVAAASLQEAASTSYHEAKKKLEDLRAALRNVLPSYMIPSHFLLFDRIPLNYAGKTDRRLLRETMVHELDAEASRPYSGASRTLPSTAMQKELQPLWEEILGLPSGTAAMEDDFFDRGDSISTIRLVSAARKPGLQLSAAEIFKLRTFADIADGAKSLAQNLPTRLDSTGVTLEVSEAETSSILRQYQIDLDDVEAIIPTLGTQEYLMHESLSHPGANVMQTVYELFREVNLDVFRQSWEHVVASTETLRTRLLTVPGVRMFQAVLKS